MKDFGFFKGLPFKESNEDFAAYFMRFSICATYCTLSNTSMGRGIFGAEDIMWIQ